MTAYQKYLDYFQSGDIIESFLLERGDGTVMISAPHSVEQIRSGSPKYAEPQTGVLAKMLRDALNCPIICKTRNCGDDANYDEHSPYRDTLRDYINENHIKYLLDLHQMAPERKENIDLGTGRGVNISPDPLVADIVKNHFSARHISEISVNALFSASYPYTVSSTIFRECGICCLQIEINSRLLCDQYPDFCFDSVFSALSDTVRELRDR